MKVLRLDGERLREALPKRNTISINNLLFSGIPKNFFYTKLKDFETYEIKELIIVKNAVAGYMYNLLQMFNKNKGILFMGNNGVGKSMLACLILKQAYIERFTIRRITFMEYISKYTKVWGTKTTEEKENIEAELYSYTKGVDFLCLEEIGKEIDSKIAVPILEELLRYREDKGLPTIICTNLTPDKINAMYGTSVFSLIQGNMMPIRIIDTDKRLKTAEERWGNET